MKSIIKYSGFFIMALFIFVACKKSANQNPLADVKNLGIGSYITLNSKQNLNFVYNTPTSLVSIKVDQYPDFFT